MSLLSVKFIMYSLDRQNSKCMCIRDSSKKKKKTKAQLVTNHHYRLPYSSVPYSFHKSHRNQNDHAKASYGLIKTDQFCITYFVFYSNYLKLIICNWLLRNIIPGTLHFSITLDTQAFANMALYLEQFTCKALH